MAAVSPAVSERRKGRQRSFAGGPASSGGSWPAVAPWLCVTAFRRLCSEQRCEVRPRGGTRSRAPRSSLKGANRMPRAGRHPSDVRQRAATASGLALDPTAQPTPPYRSRYLPQNTAIIAFCGMVWARIWSSPVLARWPDHVVA